MAAHARRLVAAGAASVTVIRSVPGVSDQTTGEEQIDARDALRLAGAQIDLPPQTHVLRVSNRGFGDAANRASREGCASWILFINPDIVPDGGVLERLGTVLGAAPDRVGVVGGLSIPLEIDSAQGPTQRRQAPSLSSHGTFPGLLDRLRPAADPPRSPAAVDWVSGAFMAVRRAAFVEVGGFDPRYFMQMEDVDLCRRLRRRRWDVRMEPSLTYTHQGHLSYQRSGRDHRPDYWRSKARFLIHHRPSLALIYVPYAAVRLGAAALARTIAGRPAAGVD